MTKNRYKKESGAFSDRQVTNKTLAEKMNVGEMTISRWMTNKFQPSMSHSWKYQSWIANALY